MIELQIASPLIIISFFAVLILLFEVYSGKEKKTVYITALIGLILTALSALYTLLLPHSIFAKFDPAHSISKGMLIFGAYTAYFDIIFCLAGILTLLASLQYLKKERFFHNEYFTLIIYSVAGMMFISHAGNLLMLFIGIEVMSISFYILAGFFRTRITSIEAALKYFLLGAFASGFLLYGMAMIYGSTGSLEFSVITEKIISGKAIPIYLAIGFGLMIIGLSFKVAAFPFHLWAPDVYEGSPTVITGFMSTAGKAAALVAFIVVVKAVLPHSGIANLNAFDSHSAIVIIAFISAATMLIGNITALVQKNVKRMLAYSSIAHAGYLLMGIVANNNRGWSGIAFYSAAYLFMQVGAFLVVSAVENEAGEGLELSDYSGLSKTNPVLAALMALFMLSLAGIPPMAGFFGKYYLFVSAIESGFTWLTIVAVIASIISVYFYIGLIVQMYFKEPLDKMSDYKASTSKFALAISAAGLLLFGIFPNLLINIADKLF